MDFQEYFEKTRGPVTIDGVTYCLSFAFVRRKDSICRVTFESANGPFRQGLHIESDTPITINNKSSKKCVVWKDKAPPVVEFHISADQIVWIWNVWDRGNGVTEAGYNGHAMMIDKVGEAKWRFRCNDYRPDDACDDLILTLELQ